MNGKIENIHFKLDFEMPNMTQFEQIIPHLCEHPAMIGSEKVCMVFIIKIE